MMALGQGIPGIAYVLARKQDEENLDSAAVIAATSGLSEEGQAQMLERLSEQRNRASGFVDTLAEFPVTAMVDAALAVEWSSDLVNWRRLGERFEWGSSDTFPQGGTPIQLILPGPSDEIYFRLRCELAGPR